MSRFTFHETDTLANDIGQFAHECYPDSSAGNNPSVSFSQLTPNQSPGIILLYDDRPCAAIGYTRESTGTMLIAKPVVLRKSSDDVCLVLNELLLKQVKRRALADGYVRMHFLQQESSDESGFPQLLQKLAFEPASRILCWEWTPAGDSLSHGEQVGGTDLPATAGKYTVQLHDPATTSAAISRELHESLDTILQSSLDLSGQPEPKAADLLARWENMQAYVFVCRVNQVIAGVMSLAINIQVPRARVPQAAGWTSEVHDSIEYIGVMPAYRNQKLATLMIRQIPGLTDAVGKPVCSVVPEPDTASHSHDTAPHSLLTETPSASCWRFSDSSRSRKVTVYSDAANDPATRLYLRCGFRQTTEMHLWCCNVSGPQAR